MRLNQLTLLISINVLMVTLSGCADIARGITEGIMSANRPADEWVDRPICLINGRQQTGLGQELAQRDARNNAQLKVLMVHGIGNQLPGYSARLQSKLMDALGLSVIAGQFREIEIPLPSDWEHQDFEGPIGHLRVHRYQNREETQELLFYELTWAMITAAQKRQLDFDSSYEFSFRRAPLNASLKTFFNNSIPDPLIYLGQYQPHILSAVSQAMCWMTQGDWDDLPDRVTQFCNPYHPNSAHQLAQDHFAIITHSLGSRIILDTLQSIARNNDPINDQNRQSLRRTLQQTTIPIYMLANQLPLLQMGFDRPPVVGQIDDYCRAEGRQYEHRHFRQLSIMAFSDPNDILSYPVAPRFADDFVDSRVCPAFTDVLINIAPVQSLPIVGGIANPINAHNDYEIDPRVIDLMVWGIGQPETTELVEQRCEWRERRN